MKIGFRLGVYTAREVTDPSGLMAHGWKRFPDGTYRTTQQPAAGPFHKYAVDPQLRLKLAEADQARRAAVADSTALTSDFHVPLPDGVEARGYQRAGVEYMVGRRNALCADSMRLGKTIQAIGVGNARQIKGRSLYIVPASAKIMWKRKLDAWKTFDGDVGIAYGSEWPNTKHVVCNYDILDRFTGQMTARKWDLVVYDESRALMNLRSKRTRLALGDRAEGGIPFEQRLFLDGTPISTRTSNLWPIIKCCDPQGLGKSFKTFALRYCDGKVDEYGRLTEYDGASNLAELQHRMRKSFMVRRHKKDVAGELKPFRETVVISADEHRALLQAEREANGEATNAIDRLFQAAQAGEDLSRLFTDLSASLAHVTVTEEGELQEESLASIRQKLALTKVPRVVELVEQILQSEEKVVVFAHHKAVVRKLKEAFPDAAVLVGGMTPKQKDAAEKRFQTDPACRVFIGNIVAAGQVIRLDAADCVVFAEISWVPSELEQCEERVWDVLKTNFISIYRVVIEDSLDETMCHVVDARSRQNALALNMDAA